MPLKFHNAKRALCLRRAAYTRLFGKKRKKSEHAADSAGVRIFDCQRTPKRRADEAEKRKTLREMDSGDLSFCHHMIKCSFAGRRSLYDWLTDDGKSGFFIALNSSQLPRADVRINWLSGVQLVRKATSGFDELLPISPVTISRIDAYSKEDPGPILCKCRFVKRSVSKPVDASTVKKRNTRVWADRGG